MSKEELIKRIDAILAENGDDERQHSWEDELHLDLLEQYLPDDLWQELKRLIDADFARWCA